MRSKALRGNIRWAYRNVLRTHRIVTDLMLAYVRACGAQQAAALLARLHAAEVAHMAARGQLAALQEKRREAVRDWVQSGDVLTQEF